MKEIVYRYTCDRCSVTMEMFSEDSRELFERRGWKIGKRIPQSAAKILMHILAGRSAPREHLCPKCDGTIFEPLPTLDLQ